MELAAEDADEASEEALGRAARIGQDLLHKVSALQRELKESKAVVATLENIFDAESCSPRHRAQTTPSSGGSSVFAATSLALQVLSKEEDVEQLDAKIQDLEASLAQLRGAVAQQEAVLAELLSNLADLQQRQRHDEEMRSEFDYLRGQLAAKRAAAEGQRERRILRERPSEAQPESPTAIQMSLGARARLKQRVVRNRQR
mmetsp:Transcript_52885/g.118894  ORF Transcript_52885/g.118894 Transcript_52885/m.118894 type:complete len:201 (-) Transcript_52885:20-622(-)